MAKKKNPGCQRCNLIKKTQKSTGTIKSNGPCQRVFRMAWAEDVSAFAQHQKFLLHARKTSGTLGKRKAFLV